jgi:hypothetical protein
VDSVELVELLDRPYVFTVEGTELTATINKPEFWKSDYLVLRIIRDSYGERPVYMSRTAGPTPGELGLEPYILTQGLAEKVMYMVPKDPGPDTLRIDNNWLDLKRTKALWDSVYVAPASLMRKNKWIDFPSQGIPYLYVVTGVTLGHALQVRGDTATARTVLMKTADLAEAVKLEEGIGGPGLVENIRAMAGLTDTGGLTLPPAVPPETGRGG